MAILTHNGLTHNGARAGMLTPDLLSDGFLRFYSYAATNILSPNQINGLVGWWRADTGVWQDVDATTAATDGSKVYRWDDQSGNSRDVIAAWPYGDYEKYVASDASLSGEPAIQLNVNGRGFYYNGTWAPVTGATARSVIVVGRNFTGHNLYSLGHLVHWGNQTQDQAYGLAGKINGAAKFGNHYWTDKWAPVDNDLAAHIIMVAYDGSKDWLWLDGGGEYSNTIALNTGSTEQFKIGDRIADTEYGYGNYAEVIIYNRFLTSSERTGLFNHLSARYGITLS